MDGCLTTGKDYEDICVKCECLPNGIYCREGSQLSGEANDSFWVSQPATFPYHPILPLGPMNKVAVVAGMGAKHGLSNMDIPLPRLTQPVLLQNA